MILFILDYLLLLVMTSLNQQITLVQSATNAEHRYFIITLTNNSQFVSAIHAFQQPAADQVV